LAASINTRVGMPRMPNLSCSPGSRSVLTLTAFNLPASSLDKRSTAGATIRHGPHQGAQKSMSTGIGLFSTTALKSDPPLSVSQGRAAPHFGQWGTPSAADRIRVFCPHLGHVTTFGSLIFY